MRSALAFGLADHCIPQSLIDSDDSAGPLARYFFGTTPLYGALYAQQTVQVAAPTSGSTSQIVQILGIGTPLVVIVEASRVTTPGTGVDHAILSAGAASAPTADAVTQFCAGIRSRDAQVNNTDTGRLTLLDGLICIVVAGSNTVDGQARFVRWVLDGCEIVWDDFPAGAYLLNFTFIYGIAAHASVHQLVAGGVEDGIDTITVPYDPNVALTWWWRQSFADPASAGNNAFWHHGVAAQNEAALEQACWSMTDRDARLDSGWGQAIRDDSILIDLTQAATGAVTIGDRLAVDSFDVGEANFIAKMGGASFVGTIFRVLVVLLDTGSNRRTVQIVDLDTGTTGTGTNKKVTASSASGDWAPKALRAIGTNISV